MTIKRNDKIIYKYLKVVKSLMSKKSFHLPILAKKKYFVSVKFNGAKIEENPG